MHAKRRSGLLPAAAERLVELHDAEQFAVADLRQRKFGLEQVAVGIQRIELRIHAAAIAHVGEARAILQRGHQPLLLHAALARPLVRDQRVRDFGECGLNGLLVLNSALSRSASASFTFDLRRPPVKIGCVTCGTKLQALCGPLNKARQLRALPAQKSAEAQLREIGGLGDADIGVGGDQRLFRGANVGTALQQRGRQTRREPPAASPAR